ncbi:MAG: helix-turn-helix transcriptional regulator [Clostridia bacterium]|nr:helix-turn-helix transcriptional regulator [Clostridia bacterium]
MMDVGSKLKDLREDLKLSLKDVSIKTGISDSRLCRFEKGQECPALDLGKLADLYGVDKISLFIDAGYLTAADVANYEQIFKHASLLNDEEKSVIQKVVDLLNMKKGEFQ